MNRPDEIAALADRIERSEGLVIGEGQCDDNGRGGIASWIESSALHDSDVKLIVSALRLSATSPGDAVRMREAFRQIIVEMRDKHSSPTGDSYSCGVWDQSQRILSKLDEAALAPAEKAGDEFTRSFDTRGTTMRRRCNIIEITCETGEIANRVADQLRSPSATPTPPSGDVADETKCECGFLASACRTNPCYRKKIATSGLVPNAKYPDLGHLPATPAVSEADVELLDTKNKIIALIREGFDPEPNDWPRHRGWDDGAGEIAEKIIAVFQHSGGETTQTVETCPRCNLKADSLLHKFCTHSQCPIRSSLIQSAAHGGGTEGGERPCTCHPDDNPPQPCPQRYAYSECVKVSDPAQEQVAVARIIYEHCYTAPCGVFDEPWRDEMLDWHNSALRKSADAILALIEGRT